MGGIFKDKSPVKGEKVVIVVDDANSPSGVWNGVLVDYTKKKGYIECTAKITEEEAGAGTIPRVNYTVYRRSRGTDELKEMWAYQRELKERVLESSKAERRIYHALFSSLVSSDAVKKFEELADRLLKKS